MARFFICSQCLHLIIFREKIEQNKVVGFLTAPSSRQSSSDGFSLISYSTETYNEYFTQKSTGIKPKLLPRHGPQRIPTWEEEPNWQIPQTNLDTSPKSEPVLELISRAAPIAEAHHRSVGPDAGRNSGGRWIIKKKIAGTLSNTKLESKFLLNNLN